MSLKFESIEGTKYITVSGTTSGEIIYVVPKGRNFQGNVIMNAGGTASVNGDTLSNTGTGVGVNFFPVTLGPGMFVKAGGGTTIVSGIES